MGSEPARLGEIPPRTRLDLVESRMKISILTHNDGNCFANFTYVDIRHRILQDIVEYS